MKRVRSLVEMWRGKRVVREMVVAGMWMEKLLLLQMAGQRLEVGQRMSVGERGGRRMRVVGGSVRLSLCQVGVGRGQRS